MEIALTVLEDAAERARHDTVEQTPVIALALACLIMRQAPNQPWVRWPFEAFWRHLPGKSDIGRSANVQAALNGIYLAVGVKRTK